MQKERFNTLRKRNDTTGDQFFCLLLKSHAGIEAERLRVNASVRSLQQQLEDCRDDSSHWMEQFHSTRDELRTTKQEWVLIQSDVTVVSFAVFSHHCWPDFDISSVHVDIDFCHHLVMFSFALSLLMCFHSFSLILPGKCFSPSLSERHPATLKHSESRKLNSVCLALLSCRCAELC